MTLLVTRHRARRAGQSREGKQDEGTRLLSSEYSLPCRASSSMARHDFTAAAYHDQRGLVVYTKSFTCISAT